MMDFLGAFFMRRGTKTDGEKPEGGCILKTKRSRRPRSLWSWGGLAILLALLVSSAPWINAQIATTTATLSGVVTDPSGAVLPKATLTLTSSEKGITRIFNTDDGGRYSFNQLPPSAYSLTIKAKGFETYQQNGIVLNAAETATQNVTLTIGAETVSVSVTSDVSQLNTDNSNVAADIEAKQIVELPLNVRNVYGLATLNSSVQNTSEGQIAPGWRQQHNRHRGSGHLVHELRRRLLWNDGLPDRRLVGYRQ